MQTVRRDVSCMAMEVGAFVEKDTSNNNKLRKVCSAKELI
jgi:hypothetical protein